MRIVRMVLEALGDLFLLPLVLATLPLQLLPVLSPLAAGARHAHRAWHAGFQAAEDQRQLRALHDRQVLAQLRRRARPPR